MDAQPIYLPADLVNVASLDRYAPGRQDRRALAALRAGDLALRDGEAVAASEAYHRAADLTWGMPYVPWIWVHGAARIGTAIVLAGMNDYRTAADTLREVLRDLADYAHNELLVERAQCHGIDVVIMMRQVRELLAHCQHANRVQAMFRRYREQRDAVTVAPVPAPEIE